jgi:hypothetical protein
MRTVARFDVFFKLKVQEGPELFVATQNNVSATAAVTSVGPALRNVFFASEMRRTAATVSGGTVNFYVINKVV